MNEKINHNKIIDYCEECIRYKNLQPEKCINCGTKSVELILEGPSMIGKCTRCGNSFVVASFFAPCETDFTEYVLKIEDDNLSNDQIILLQKLLHIVALELKNFLQNKECIDKKFTLKEINEKPILFGLESDFYEHDTRDTVETEYADILEYLVKIGLKS